MQDSKNDFLPPFYGFLITDSSVYTHIRISVWSPIGLSQDQIFKTEHEKPGSYHIIVYTLSEKSCHESSTFNIQAAYFCTKRDCAVALKYSKSTTI